MLLGWSSTKREGAPGSAARGLETPAPEANPVFTMVAIGATTRVVRDLEASSRVRPTAPHRAPYASRPRGTQLRARSRRRDKAPTEVGALRKVRGRHPVVRG